MSEISPHLNSRAYTDMFVWRTIPMILGNFSICSFLVYKSFRTGSYDQQEKIFSIARTDFIAVNVTSYSTLLPVLSWLLLEIRMFRKLFEKIVILEIR